MKCHPTAKIDILVPTSMGLRLTPTTRSPIQHHHDYHLQVTSAETNVITPMAALGLRTVALTALIEHNPISTTIKGDLLRRGIQVEAMMVPQGGPWGPRHQINIADSGYGVRGPYVLNDRAGEVAQKLDSSSFPLDTLFVQDGVKILHLSGLISAISPKTAAFCKELVDIAKQNNTRISFDLNYRHSFWENRESELREVFDYIARNADILIGNEEDFQLALGIKGPDHTTMNMDKLLPEYEDMLSSIKKQYPNVSIVATTLRQVMDANTHLWGAMLLSEQHYTIPQQPIAIQDRIGGGDGFVGGLLYALLQDWNELESLQFGWAMGAYVCSVLTDYGEPLHEQQIWDIWHGNARVKR